MFHETKSRTWNVSNIHGQHHTEHPHRAPSQSTLTEHPHSHRAPSQSTLTEHPQVGLGDVGVTVHV
ncbi:hypothetical protein EYF80_044202 [Liparis tanakae]|uniref:Uncharacterized protein n=1 Tax=Liparis tanakae TaxID=230148 RepID=A0A4Z2FWF0_9TELE|nr:hypothetical protein EYF80_044202 [Liparis tanakae]